MIPFLNLEVGECVVSVSRPCLLRVPGRCGSSCCHPTGTGCMWISGILVMGDVYIATVAIVIYYWHLLVSMWCLLSHGCHESSSTSHGCLLSLQSACSSHPQTVVVWPTGQRMLFYASAIPGMSFWGASEQPCECNRAVKLNPSSASIIEVKV